MESGGEGMSALTERHDDRDVKTDGVCAPTQTATDERPLGFVRESRENSGDFSVLNLVDKIRFTNGDKICCICWRSGHARVNEQIQNFRSHGAWPLASLSSYPQLVTKG